MSRSASVRDDDTRADLFVCDGVPRVADQRHRSSGIRSGVETSFPSWWGLCNRVHSALGVLGNDCAKLRSLAAGIKPAFRDPRLVSCREQVGSLLGKPHLLEGFVDRLSLSGLVLAGIGRMLVEAVVNPLLWRVTQCDVLKHFWRSVVSSS
jgi:hypothetical protein